MNYLTPYQHPVTVVLIDDNVRFMENLCFGLHSLAVNFKIFASAKEALSWIDANNPTADFVQEQELSEHAIPSLDEYMFNNRRFDEPAILIVDYDMPEMTGLELCQAVSNKPIKKIMLTGVADEKVALDAFNHEIIDRFILKQDEDVINKAKESVVTLQKKYFKAKAACLPQSTLFYHDLPFMHESAFKSIFEDIYAQGGYVEHYVHTSPDGIWLIRANGTMDFLAVQAEDSFQDQWVIAQDRDGPKELLMALTKENIVTCFEHGFYTPGSDQTWQEAIHPAVIFEGQTLQYRYAVIENPFPKEQAKLLSFKQYLDL